MQMGQGFSAADLPPITMDDVKGTRKPPPSAAAVPASPKKEFKPTGFFGKDKDKKADTSKTQAQAPGLQMGQGFSAADLPPITMQDVTGKPSKKKDSGAMSPEDREKKVSASGVMSPTKGGLFARKGSEQPAAPEHAASTGGIKMSGLLAKKASTQAPASPKKDLKMGEGMSAADLPPLTMEDVTGKPSKKSPKATSPRATSPKATSPKGAQSPRKQDLKMGEGMSAADLPPITMEDVTGKPSRKKTGSPGALSPTAADRDKQGITSPKMSGRLGVKKPSTEHQELHMGEGMSTAGLPPLTQADLIIKPKVSSSQRLAPVSAPPPVAAPTATDDSVLTTTSSLTPAPEGDAAALPPGQITYNKSRTQLPGLAGADGQAAPFTYNKSRTQLPGLVGADGQLAPFAYNQSRTKLPGIDDAGVANPQNAAALSPGSVTSPSKMERGGSAGDSKVKGSSRLFAFSQRMGSQKLTSKFSERSGSKADKEGAATPPQIPQQPPLLPIPDFVPGVPPPNMTAADKTRWETQEAARLKKWKQEKEKRDWEIQARAEWDAMKRKEAEEKAAKEAEARTEIERRAEEQRKAQEEMTATMIAAREAKKKEDEERMKELAKDDPEMAPIPLNYKSPPKERRSANLMSGFLGSGKNMSQRGSGGFRLPERKIDVVSTSDNAVPIFFPGKFANLGEGSEEIKAAAEVQLKEQAIKEEKLAQERAVKDAAKATAKAKADKEKAEKDRLAKEKAEKEKYEAEVAAAIAAGLPPPPPPEPAPVPVAAPPVEETPKSPKAGEIEDPGSLLSPMSSSTQLGMEKVGSSAAKVLSAKDKDYTMKFTSGSIPAPISRFVKQDCDPARGQDPNVDIIAFWHDGFRQEMTDLQNFMLMWEKAGFGPAKEKVDVFFKWFDIFKNCVYDWFTIDERVFITHMETFMASLQDFDGQARAKKRLDFIIAAQELDACRSDMEAGQRAVMPAFIARVQVCLTALLGYFILKEDKMLSQVQETRDNGVLKDSDIERTHAVTVRETLERSKYFEYLIPMYCSHMPTETARLAWIKSNMSFMQARKFPAMWAKFMQHKQSLKSVKQ